MMDLSKIKTPAIIPTEQVLSLVEYRMFFDKLLNEKRVDLDYMCNTYLLFAGDDEIYLVIYPCMNQPIDVTDDINQLKVIAQYLSAFRVPEIPKGTKIMTVGEYKKILSHHRDNEPVIVKKAGSDSLSNLLTLVKHSTLLTNMGPAVILDFSD